MSSAFAACSEGCALAIQIDDLVEQGASLRKIRVSMRRKDWGFAVAEHASRRTRVGAQDAAGLVSIGARATSKGSANGLVALYATVVIGAALEP